MSNNITQKKLTMNLQFNLWLYTQNSAQHLSSDFWTKIKLMQKSYIYQIKTLTKLQNLKVCAKENFTLTDICFSASLLGYVCFKGKKVMRKERWRKEIWKPSKKVMERKNLVGPTSKSFPLTYARKGWDTSMFWLKSQQYPCFYCFSFFAIS